MTTAMRLIRIAHWGEAKQEWRQDMTLLGQNNVGLKVGLVCKVSQIVQQNQYDTDNCWRKR